RLGRTGSRDRSMDLDIVLVNPLAGCDRFRGEADHLAELENWLAWSNGCRSHFVPAQDALVCRSHAAPVGRGLAKRELFEIACAILRDHDANNAANGVVSRDRVPAIATLMPDWSLIERAPAVADR